jgi:hypothetical protein
LVLGSRWVAGWVFGHSDGGLICSGSRWVAGWVFGHSDGGLICSGSGWVAGWLAVGLWGDSQWWWWVFGLFQWCWGVVFFFFFLRCTKYCKIFVGVFFRMQLNIEKQSFSLKSFTFENILYWKILYDETNET